MNDYTCDHCGKPFANFNLCRMHEAECERQQKQAEAEETKSNQIRCVAAEIIARLYEVKDVPQLKLLKQQIDASLASLGEKNADMLLNNFVELCKTWACTVQQNSILGRPKFCVIDVDGEMLSEGNTPEEAAELAIRFIENRE